MTGWRTTFLWTLAVITFFSLETGICDENVKEVAVTTTIDAHVVKEDAKQYSTEEAPSLKSKEKPIIVVAAERVENPPNWNSWTPTAYNSTNWLPTAFTPADDVTHVTTGQRIVRQPQSHYRKGVKKQKKQTGYEKWTLEDIQSRVMNYGRMLMGNFMTGFNRGGGRFEDLKSSSSDYSESSTWSNSHGHSETHQSENSGFSGERGLVNWLSRLIGVDGKSLGEFLREYQVHVLYDLVFTFFKWIFFLYAGLLIP